MCGEHAEGAPTGMWRIIGASVCGANHLRLDRPNQDALHWRPRGGRADHLVLAVADGHGGARYVRSQIGAWYAVRTITEIFTQEVLPVLSAESNVNLSRLKRAFDEWLPKVLVRRWRARIERHVRRYPLTEQEHALFMRGQAQDHNPDPVMAYGATLLAAFLTPCFHLYIQLGDGDILTVSAEGKVSRPPLPVDPRLLGNETTSLCSPQAWRHVRLSFQSLVETTPAMILLSTDGYANSFVDESGFEQVGADLLRLVRAEGLDTVATHLPGWLQDTSASGSGDDITLALAIWEEAMHDSG